MEKRLWIDVEGAGRVSGSLSLPDGTRESTPWTTGILLAHGARGHMDHPDLVQFARDLSEAGHPVLRFNFFYTASGRKAPDGPPPLTVVWEAAHRAFAAREDFGAGSRGEDRRAGEGAVFWWPAGGSRCRASVEGNEWFGAGQVSDGRTPGTRTPRPRRLGFRPGVP